MDAQQLQRVLARLPNEEIRFSYFRDRYALMLLSYFVGEGRTVREIKGSRYAGLLEKPAVKALIRNLPDGRLTAEALRSVRSEKNVEFVITLDQFGCGSDGTYWSYQVSREGCNLVLQMNFSDRHDRDLVRMVAPGSEGFTLTPYTDHPVSDVRKTMSWVRIDIDDDFSEALIEEVQSDWIRAAEYKRKAAQRLVEEDKGVRQFSDITLGANCAPRDFLYYTDRVLRPYASIWSEATLAAAIWLLVDLLGVERIFYHTPESSGALKDVYDAPRSLYTDLPRKFCFQEVKEYPFFLQSALVAESLAVEGGDVSSGRIVEKETGALHGAAERAGIYLLDLR